MTGWIGIAIGDITGVGPEVVLKALARIEESDASRYLLIGDARTIRDLNTKLGLHLSIASYQEADQKGRFFFFNPSPETLESNLPCGAPSAAHAALAYLKYGAERCLKNELDALVTAPVNKEAIIRTGFPFVGQTELLSELAGAKRTAMMLLGEDDRGRWLRVALASTHVPLRKVAEVLTGPQIEASIELASKACQDLGLKRARVGVCGLNPHAGEGGKLGTEEITLIAPAVRAVQQRKIDAHGPISADALFYQAYQGDYDAVVAMYHDQGLVPLKMIGFETGVNWTLGLPFIRTSPDHGTAYDIAGEGTANPSSMIAALTLAKKLVRK